MRRSRRPWRLAEQWHVVLGSDDRIPIPSVHLGPDGFAVMGDHTLWWAAAHGTARAPHLVPGEPAVLVSTTPQLPSAARLTVGRERPPGHEVAHFLTPVAHLRGTTSCAPARTSGSSATANAWTPARPRGFWSAATSWTRRRCGAWPPAGTPGGSTRLHAPRASRRRPTLPRGRPEGSSGLGVGAVSRSSQPPARACRTASARLMLGTIPFR